MIFQSQMCPFSPAYPWFFTYSLANYRIVYLDESNIIRWFLPLKLHTHRAVAILNGWIIQSRALPSGLVPSSQWESSAMPILLLMPHNLPVHLTFHFPLIHEQDFKILKLILLLGAATPPQPGGINPRFPSRERWPQTESHPSLFTFSCKLQMTDDENRTIPFAKSRGAFLFSPI